MGKWEQKRGRAPAAPEGGQAALAECARHGANNLLRTGAIACLEDKALLEELHREDRDEQVRRAAKRRLHFLATGEEDYTFPVEREIPGLVGMEAYDDVCFACTGDRIAVRRGEKLGFANRAGDLAIPLIYDGKRPLYDVDYCFHEGVAAVEKAGLWGGVDRTGHTVVPFVYDGNFAFHEGLAPVCKEGMYGYIDAEGREVIPLAYGRAHRFSEGKAVVEKDGTELVIDRAGKVLFALEGCTTEYAPEYLGGYLRVGRQVEGGDGAGGQRMLFGLLNARGEVAIPLVYDELDNFFVEDVRPAAKDGVWGAVDNTGKVVIPFEYDRVWNFDDSVALVRKGGKYGVFDRAGHALVPVRYQDMDYPAAGAFPAKYEGKWGLIDRAEKVILPFEYDGIGIFYKNRAVVRKGEKYGCVAPGGEMAVPIAYDEVEGFEDTGSTMVRLEDKYGCVGPSNELLFPILYDGVCWPMEGVAIVRAGCDLMVVDGAGRVVYPHPLDSYRALDETYCWVLVHGTWRMLRAPGW